MKKTLDVNRMNPLLKSAISIFENVMQLHIVAGEPVTAECSFQVPTYTVTIGVSGQVNGKVVFAIDMERAKEIAGRMLVGSPIVEFDELACSALDELGNMIMGNAAIIFSTLGKQMDITTPVSAIEREVLGMTDAICIPFMLDETDLFRVYVCLYEA